MKKLISLSVSLITFSLLNQGYSQEGPILIDSEQKTIMQNPLIRVEISKESGEISSFIYRHSDSAMNLLTKPACINFRDKRANKGYQQYDGEVDTFYTETYPDSVRAIFDINFNGVPSLTEPQYALRIIFTLSLQALRWYAILQTDLTLDWEANIEFSIPVMTNMEYAFWTDTDAPFKLPITQTIVYRRRPFVIPDLILYNNTSNIGLSFVSPFELKKPGLQFQIKEDSFNISNYYLRLSKNHPAHAAVYIVPHEGCWRPGFAWLYDKYSEYFNPISQTVLNGEGWFTIGTPYTPESKMMDAQDRGVKWVEFLSYYPFFGLYAPTDRNSWMIIIDRNDIFYKWWEKDSIPDIAPRPNSTSYAKNDSQIERWWNNFGIQTYIYFQSFESWKQYAKKYYPNDIAIGSNEETLPAWKYCYLMNPDPNHPWGKHIISQIHTIIDKYPDVDGIFYDRDDYCNYDYNHNDNITMIGNKPVYMLGFAQEKINELILTKVHKSGKGVWANLPTSVEVCKGMDGIMSEDLKQAPYVQYLGLNRPLILLPYDTTPLQTEEKLKTALYTGHFPSIAWYRANPECFTLDARYQPLFTLFKSKKWVLYHHALLLPEGIKGNIFQASNSDYLVAMIDPGKFSTKSDPFQYNKWAKVRVPDFQKIRYCYLLSGDYKGINQSVIYKDNSINIKIPAHRVSSLIRLSKEPRYEITRTSSPVLTRGDSERFIVRIQNIDTEQKQYYLQVTTPFPNSSKSDRFPLKPDSIKEETLDFEVPVDHPLGEDTMKVILQSNENDTTVIFTSWVVDFVQFYLPDSLLFIHFTDGETIPFTLVNNTERRLNLKLKSSFVDGRGEVKLLTRSVTLNPLETKELLVKIVSKSEKGKVKIVAEAERRTVETIRPVERTMKPSISDIFYDDFSTRDMKKWDDTTGLWKIDNDVAKGTGGRHLAIKNGNWKNFQFQVNTKIEGSPNPSVDWLKSYIFFRVKNVNNYYRFGIQGGSDADDISLWKRVNRKWYFLAKYQFNAKKDVWYNLRVEVKGDNIKGFLDGFQVINVQDTTFKSGGIGIGVQEDDMITYYDDVVVRTLPK